MTDEQHTGGPRADPRHPHRRDRDGAPIPWPCAEPERVDELRAGLGIAPFAAYTAAFAPADASDWPGAVA